jgi:Kef-type K+ transport system membrane component KefB/nucleotide-binding universal stress UspA family protein
MPAAISPVAAITTETMQLSPILRRSCLSAVFLALTTAPAFAAEAAKGPSEAVFIAQLIVLLVIGRLLGEVMLRLGQAAVMGQLIAGIILGPSLLGAVWPDLQHLIFPRTPEQKAMIDAVAQLGVLMLLLLAGMETDLQLVKKTGRASLCVSLTGILVPFACGFALGESLPDSILPHPEQRLVTSLFLGTALSISSVKIVAMVVREMNFMRRTVGQVILASAIIDDSIGWIITAIIFSLAMQGEVDPASVAKSVIGTLVFLAASLTVGRRIVSTLIRWANDNFVSEFPVITMILVIMGVMALITHEIGVHTVLGAFVAGVLIGESPILARHIDEQLRGLITALFMPVFFGMAGLTADLTVLKDPYLLLLTLGFIAIASVGKFGGAFSGGRLGGLTLRESFAVGCGMNARGSSEVIIATIGLSMGALSENLFTIIVTMAILTTMAMPPMLRWALARLPLHKAERERLEREELEAKGFVSNLERLLLAIDDSANGKFASRLAGLIAGSKGMPTTVMQLPSAKSTQKDSETAEEQSPEAAVKTAADANAARKTKAEEAKPEPVDVTTKISEKPANEAIAHEAKKGYDLLLVGLEKTIARKKEFHPEVNLIASGFEGPLAIADARGKHLEDPLTGKLNILVPISGTEISRNAAEVAFAIARARKTPVTALYVAVRDSNGSNKRPRRSIKTRQHEDAILKDMIELADTYDIAVKTAVRGEVAPEAAILQEAERGGHNLIVMGVSRRPGDKLFFGNTAAAIMENTEASLLFVAS